MNKSVLMLSVLALAITGCRDDTSPEVTETTEERVERAVQQADRSMAVRDPETGNYVSTIPGDPAGTAVESDERDEVDAAQDAQTRRHDAEAELIRARLACDELPGTDRSACLEHAEAAHEKALAEGGDASTD